MKRVATRYGAAVPVEQPDRQVVPRAIPLWLVWLAAGVFVFGGLGNFGILDNNEGLYAEVAREMLVSSDWHRWVIPHLNGLPYLEKPPLLYWLTALSFALFGPEAWAARLVPALSTVSCVGMLLAFGRATGRESAGRLAALMFVSGAGVIALSHLLMFDMLLTALLTAAMMLAWIYRSSHRVAALRWAYVFLALAVLAKGLVALVLFGLVVFIALFPEARARGQYRGVYGPWFDPVALLLFAAIALPWHVAAAAVEPAFAWIYFVNEHLLRFLGLRVPHDYYGGAWWYYLPRIAVYLFPWSFLLPGLLRVPPPRTAGDAQAFGRFLLVAWLAPLLFFSLSSAKANYYLVAVMPFAAFHLADALERRGFRDARTRALPGVQIALLAGVLCMVVAGRADDGGHQVTMFGLLEHQFLFVLFGGAGLLALAAAWWAARAERVGVLAYLLLSVWIAVGLLGAMRAMDPQISTREMAGFLQRELPARSVYLYWNFEEQSSLPFYLRRPLPVVDAHSSDLYWGSRIGPNHVFVSRQEFLRTLARQPVAIIVMWRELDRFRSTGLAAHFSREKRIGDSTVFFN